MQAGKYKCIKTKCFFKKLDSQLRTIAKFYIDPEETKEHISIKKDKYNMIIPLLHESINDFIFVERLAFSLVFLSNFKFDGPFCREVSQSEFYLFFPLICQDWT